MPSRNRLLVVNAGSRAAAAAAALLLVSTCVLAEEPAAPVESAADAAPAPTVVRPQPRTHHAHTRPSLDVRVSQFAKSYGLDAAQQAAVRKILEQRQQEDLQIRSDASISGETRIERFRALQAATVSRIRAVLTDEQRQKYNPLATRDIPKAEGQRSVEDWLKLTTPH